VEVLTGVKDEGREVGAFITLPPVLGYIQHNGCTACSAAAVPVSTLSFLGLQLSPGSSYIICSLVPFKLRVGNNVPLLQIYIFVFSIIPLFLHSW
jgi:hypothetical protein